MQIEDMNYTIDLASEKSIVEQGYDHLISLPTWSGAVND